MAGNPDCKHEEHNMHMCALKESGFDKENPEKFRAMTDNPKYKCGNCGATANESKHLCQPVGL